MKKQLLFNFTINKADNTVHAQREFDADLNLVWDAWTKAEILDQWWAPKPYQNKTKSMDFREGGLWHYCMISPQNEVHWCRNDYYTINPHKSYSGLDAFCDELGTINDTFPRTLWTNTFEENGETTVVNIVAKYNSLADLEQVISMGFQEGFSMALGNLDAYFESVKLGS
jgi:uncharacterized protein YndB with AHSA1/START domain